MKNYEVTWKMVGKSKASSVHFIAGNNDEASKKASKLFTDFSDANGLSSSGLVYVFVFNLEHDVPVDEFLVSCISYNGRIWNPEEYASRISRESMTGKYMIKFGYNGKFMDE